MLTINTGVLADRPAKALAAGYAALAASAGKLAAKPPAGDQPHPYPSPRPRLSDLDRDQLLTMVRHAPGPARILSQDSDASRIIDDVIRRISKYAPYTGQSGEGGASLTGRLALALLGG